MTVSTIVELVAAAALLVGGFILWRRRGRVDPQHGSQTAVILIVIGAIMAIHGLGLLEYRASGGSL